VRLQLIAAALWLPALANAGGGVAVRLDVYQDEWFEVFLPAVEASYEGEDVGVNLGYQADFLSGATQVMVTDTLTGATTFSEVRHALDVALAVHPSELWTVNASYSHGDEPDYKVNGGRLGYSMDLFERMSTVSLTYGFTLERVGRAQSEFWEDRATHSLDVGWAQILDRHTSLTFMASGSTMLCGEELGCLANAYRYVPITDDDDLVSSAPERTPDRLTRGALGLRLARALGNTTAIHGAYRFYFDSWAVTGHTLDHHISQSVWGDRLLLRGQIRLSHQSGASFYADDYEASTGFGQASLQPGIPSYRTGDRELSGYDSLLLGGRIQWSFFGVGPLVQLSFNVRLTGIFYRYPQFTELPTRTASVIGGGMEASF